MIPKGFVSGMDFHRLTRAEAIAFVIFEFKEKARHVDDIRKIREDIKNVCKVHGIDGLELSGLFNFVEPQKAGKSGGIRALTP